MVEDGAFSHKIDYTIFLREILNLEEHQNCKTGSKVTAILLNRWIMPIGGASAVKGLRLQPAQQVGFIRELANFHAKVLLMHEHHKTGTV